jgi:hypothetical protein
VPPAPPAKRSFLFLWIGIGMVAVLAVALTAGVYLVQYLSGRTPAAVSVPVASTAPTPTPVSCEGICFTAEEARSLFPSDAALAILGSPMYGEQSPLPNSTAGEYKKTAFQGWAQANGYPADCGFLIAQAPVSPNSPTSAAGSRSEPIVDLGNYHLASLNIIQSVRVFQSESLAADYRADLRDALSRCPHFTLRGTEGLYASDADIVDNPISPAVGAIGWNEPNPDESYRTEDLQYGNLVVRVVINRLADSTVTDADVEAYLHEIANEMVALGG